jgi:pectate lyase
MRLSVCIIIPVLLLTTCRAQLPTVPDNSSSTIPIAFPGAEGFGKYTTGGRGGKTMIVTNLNDDGEGSFRKAATAKEPRIIVFAISGTIHLNSPLSIRSNATIAGQTAPGDGICIADQPVNLNGDNIIVRYLRFRLGDKYQDKGKIPGSGHDDAFGANKRKNIIIDHCSMSWSTDEVFSVYDGDSTTLQWNIISEPLNYSYHFEEGDTDFEKHGYGAIWGGKHLTAHHNLFAHCTSRNPRFAGIRTTPEELVDYRNNVIYNWGSNNVYGGEGGNYNIVNNYYKYGPSTSQNVRSRIVNPSKETTRNIPYGKYYVAGNFVEGSADITNNNRLGIHFGNEATENEKNSVVRDSIFAVVRGFTESAENAYHSVLGHAGASFQRDTLDARIINDVKNRTGRIIDVQGGYPHGTPYDKTINAWPFLKTKTAAVDTDMDGMPDDWEKKQNLDPANPADAKLISRHAFYTNIEVYINEIVPPESYTPSVNNKNIQKNN